MENFEIPENPEYIEQIRKFETTDPGHADLFNEIVRALVNNDTFLKKVAEQQAEVLTNHLNDKNNPHSTSKDQLILENVDNTSDLNKPVSKAQQAALDETYQQSTGYTDQRVADLIGGAPETLDTLKEVTDAIKENKDVVDALDAAIGNKANQAELDTHAGNSTIHITAKERERWNRTSEDVSDCAVTFVTEDTADSPSGYMDSFLLLKSGLKLKDIFFNLSIVFKNMRYIWNRLMHISIPASSFFTAALPTGVSCTIHQYGGSINLYFSISTAYAEPTVSLTTQDSYKPFFTVSGIYSVTNTIYTTDAINKAKDDYNNTLKQAYINSNGKLLIELRNSSRSNNICVYFNYPVRF